MLGTRIKRIKAFAVAACALALVVPAVGATDSTDITVQSGSLTITTDPTVTNFANITLNGSTQTRTATMDDFEVNDSRGTGVGWHVTVQGTQFAEHNGTIYVVSGKTLPLGSLSMPTLSVAQDGTSSPVPTITGGPYLIDGASAVSVASAAVGDGMGKYDFTDGGAAGMPLTLTVLPNAYAKTYRSDVTVSIVTGP